MKRQSGQAERRATGKGWERCRVSCRAGQVPFWSQVSISFFVPKSRPVTFQTVFTDNSTRNIHSGG